MKRLSVKKHLIAILIVFILALSAVGCFPVEDGTQVDKTALNAEIALEITEQGDYTADSYNAYVTKLTDAKAVANDEAATQEAVDEACEALSGARAALTVRPIEEVEGGNKEFRLLSGDSKEIALSDYVNANGLSKIAYDVKVSNAVLSKSAITDGKFTLTAGDVLEETSVTVSINVSYDGVKKLTVELTVVITNDSEPVVKKEELVKELDMFDLENKESVVLDFAENVDNAGNLELTYSATLDGEDLDLDGSLYTLALGEYTDEVVYKTITVTVSYVANGEEKTIEYTYKLGLKDTGTYRVENGSFENGLEGWELVNTVGEKPFGGIDNKTTFWGEGYVMNSVGSYFSAYADGAEEASQGTLASSYFVVNSEYATYMLGGAGNHSVYITIENKDGEVLAIYRNTKFTDFPEGEYTVEEKREMIGNTVFLANFVTYKVSLAEFKGQEIRFVIHDHASAGWGVVFFDELNTLYTSADSVPENAILAENLLADKTALNAEIALEIAEQGDYTSDSFNAYREKLAAAKALVDDVAVTQEAVNNAVASLSEARLALTVRPVEEVAGANKSFGLISDNTKDITIADYVNDNGLSDITYGVTVNSELATVSEVNEGKFTITAGTVDEATDVTVSITVYYKGEEKLTVELTVNITNDVEPVIKNEIVVVDHDLFNLENKTEITLDFADNIDNVGNLDLTYSAVCDGEDLSLNGSSYTLTFGEYTDEVVYKTITVTVSYTANGNSESIQYTYKLGLKDTTAYRLVNGGFEEGMTGWTQVGNIGGIGTDPNYWYGENDGNGIPFYMDGSNMFSSYVEGVPESAVGVLTSSTFTVGGSGYVTFKLGAMKNGDKVYMDVVNAETNEIIVRYYNGNWSDVAGTLVRGCSLEAYVADLSAHIGKKVYFRLVDNSHNDYGLFFADSFETYYETKPEGFNDATPVGYDVPKTIYDICNGSFETGDITGWNSIITEAGSQNSLGWVSAEEHEADWYTKNDGVKDGTYLMTFVLPGDKNNCESTKGTLQSSIFTLQQGKFVSFKFGGAGTRDVYVQLCAADGTVIANFYNEAPGKVNTAMYNYYYQYTGETKDCFFRVVDNSTGNYGCFVIDDFRVNLESKPEGSIDPITQ